MNVGYRNIMFTKPFNVTFKIQLNVSNYLNLITLFELNN